MYTDIWASQAVLVVQNLPANASIPGSGRSFWGGHGNSLQYSCLENPMDRAAWRAIVHGVAKEPDTAEQLSTAVLLQKCCREAMEAGWGQGRVCRHLDVWMHE